MNENKPLLIIGLGNPGDEYLKTRHNAGFIALDLLAGSSANWKSEHKSMIAKMDYCGSDAKKYKIIFARPQTFMNLSGNAVQSIMAFYKIPLENLVVIHDDMDLKLGDVREKVGGGSAGHNGIRSIATAVGPDFRRIRIGIGHPRDTGSPIDPADWVLGKFSAAEMKTLISAINNIVLST